MMSSGLREFACLHGCAVICAFRCCQLLLMWSGMVLACMVLLRKPLNVGLADYESLSLPVTPRLLIVNRQ